MWTFLVLKKNKLMCIILPSLHQKFSFLAVVQFAFRCKYLFKIREVNHGLYWRRMNIIEKFCCVRFAYCHWPAIKALHTCGIIVLRHYKCHAKYNLWTLWNWKSSFNIWYCTVGSPDFNFTLLSFSKWVQLNKYYSNFKITGSTHFKIHFKR